MRFGSNPSTSANPSTSGVPLMCRRAVRLELVNSFFFAIVLAAIEPGVVSVYVKQSFGEQVSASALAFAVAFVGSSGEFANILSFIWTPLNQAKPKVPFINRLQAGVLACVLLMAAIPVSGAGLVCLLVCMLAARVLWSGIITVRPTVWRANYPRDVRAGLVGRFGLIEVLVIAAVSLSIGLVLDVRPGLYSPVLIATAVLGVGAIASLSRLRVRREHRVLREESKRTTMKPWQWPASLYAVLRKDKFYARFMLCMFVLGFGNLMLPPITVIIAKDQFGLTYLPSILLITVGPRLVQAASIPMWARLLNRTHVVRFRSIHSWTFVVAGVAFTAGAASGSLALLAMGTTLMGLGFGGGALAWNLGHTDFAPVSETSHYMATHLTLNGIRGIVAPFLSVAIFQALTKWQLPAGAIVYGTALAISAAGAFGFVALNRAMGELAAKVSRHS
ncbi:MAG: MFS transporter [Phycisphaerales bacterium]